MLENLLSFPAKRIFLFFVFIIVGFAVYWTIMETGPGLWAINLQTTYLFEGEYYPKLNILILALIGGIPAYLIALGFDFVTKQGLFEKKTYTNTSTP